MSDGAAEYLESALEAEADAYRLLLAGSSALDRLTTARDAYLASHARTGQSSWGRLLGALKMAILAGSGVAPIVSRALEETAGVATPAAQYVRALAEVADGRSPDVGLMTDAGGAFARTGRALEALAGGDADAYAHALAEILADFESRGAFLTGVAAADTVMVLEALAQERGIAVGPTSALVPRPPSGG